MYVYICQTLPTCVDATGVCETALEFCTDNCCDITAAGNDAINLALTCCDILSSCECDFNDPSSIDCFDCCGGMDEGLQLECCGGEPSCTFDSCAGIPQ